MIGYIILVVIVLTELIFNAILIYKKQLFRKVKSIINLSELGIMVLLMAIGVIRWSFRWKLLFLVLIVRGLIALFILFRFTHGKQEKNYKLSKVVLRGVNGVFLLLICMVPALIFPQCKQLSTSGTYEVATKSYTWEDTNRLETFENDGSNRNVTVQFWYPVTKTDNAGGTDEKFPLVVFSHGAFGYRYSNYSTFQELASNGYVVCSIDHTYHAFFTKQTDGKVITANSEFIKSVLLINEEGTSEDEIFATTRPWMELRSGDMNFVLDTIEQSVSDNSMESAFANIDISKIGVMGHSLGGAAAVTTGRLRDDVDAVIDVDGTMLSEELDCVDNKYVINEEPYPVPLLAIDTTEHYEQGLTYGSQYVNNLIIQNAEDGMEIHFNGATHMDFTDLPRFSPYLASKLDRVGAEHNSANFDSTACIRTMNGVILNYYNHYLKNNEELNIKESY